MWQNYYIMVPNLKENEMLRHCTSAGILYIILHSGTHHILSLFKSMLFICLLFLSLWSWPARWCRRTRRSTQNDARQQRARGIFYQIDQTTCRTRCRGDSVRGGRRLKTSGTSRGHLHNLNHKLAISSHKIYQQHCNGKHMTDSLTIKQDQHQTRVICAASLASTILTFCSTQCWHHKCGIFYSQFTSHHDF